MWTTWGAHELRILARSATWGPRGYYGIHVSRPSLLRRVDRANYSIVHTMKVLVGLPLTLECELNNTWLRILKLPARRVRMFASYQAHFRRKSGSPGLLGCFD